MKKHREEYQIKRDKSPVSSVEFNYEGKIEVVSRDSWGRTHVSNGIPVGKIPSAVMMQLMKKELSKKR